MFACDPPQGQFGYLTRQRLLKRVKEIFARWETVAGRRNPRYLGLQRNRLWVGPSCVAYNLVRLANLSPATA